MAHKGGLVEVKIVRKADNLVAVGIKVGDGSIEASQNLHKRFQELLNAAQKPAAGEAIQGTKHEKKK